MNGMILGLGLYQVLLPIVLILANTTVPGARCPVHRVSVPACGPPPCFLCSSMPRWRVFGFSRRGGRPIC